MVGATGLVGREMLTVLDESDLSVSEVIPVASERSIGKKVLFGNNELSVVGMQQAISLKPDYALFSAGGQTSLKWAPKFANAGITVIDNSSAWRMNPNVPLIVPEVSDLSEYKNARIIANPNCSTIQLMVALGPLHRAFGLNRVVISTYQSVTGTGKAAVEQLEAEERGTATSESVYPHRIHRNCLPHCDVFLENGYTKEEMKLVNESRKILKLPDLKITATAVRVPVVGGHSESVNVTFRERTTVQAIRNLMTDTPGVIVQDDPSEALYPMPLLSHGRNEVFVGRIRKDESAENGFNLWIVADNLRKGAATNAVQILQRLSQ